MTANVDLCPDDLQGGVWDGGCPHTAESQQNKTEHTKEIEWSRPVPLGYADNRPEFPVHALDGDLREWVAAQAVALQVPADLPAWLGLASIASVVQRLTVVQVRDGWIEPVNIYTAIVLEPATRKSSAFAAAIDPIEQWEAEEAERLGPEIARAASEHRILESRLADAERKASKAEPDKRRSARERATELAEELEAHIVPLTPRRIADDITPEKLSGLVAAYGRMGVMSPEGGGPLAMMRGRYSRNGSTNLEVYLKSHSGDTLRVDRIGRPGEHVPRPALTMALAVQPEVIRGLADEPGLRGQGLLARYAWAIPDSPVGHRQVDPPAVPTEISAGYRRLIRSLLALPVSDTPIVLKLSSEARAALLRFAEWLEPRLGTNGELATISDWGGKLVGLIARIAGLLHSAYNAYCALTNEIEIPVSTVNKALEIGQYLIPHAQAVFCEIGSDPAIESARYIHTKIIAGNISRFAKRDLFNLTRARFRTVADLDAALNILMDHGYIRRERTKPSERPGRKPSPVFLVNPYTHNPQNTQNSKSTKISDHYRDRLRYAERMQDTQNYPGGAI